MDVNVFVVAILLVLRTATGQEYKPFPIDAAGPHQIAPIQPTREFQTLEVNQEPYQTNKPSFVPTGFAHFPEIGSGFNHGYENHLPYAQEPTLEKPIPYGISPPPNTLSGLKPSIFQEQHFLTRPVSFIHTGQGPHYVPHPVSSGAAPVQWVNAEPELAPEHHHTFSPAQDVSKITVFAKNIFINSANREENMFPIPGNLFADKIPFVRPQAFPSMVHKSLLMAMLMMTKQHPNKIQPNFKPLIDAVPLNELAASTYWNRSPVHNNFEPLNKNQVATSDLTNNFRPCSGAEDCSELSGGSLPETIREEKEKQQFTSEGLLEFHPLLKPQPNDGRNLTSPFATLAENIETMPTSSAILTEPEKVLVTGLDGMSVETGKTN